VTYPGLYTDEKKLKLQRL